MSLGVLARSSKLAPVPLLALVVAFSALGDVVPLTYDEGFNYLEISSHGLVATASYYSYPNNHMLFTLAQSLLPDALVRASPHLLRLPNLFYLGLLIWSLLRALAPIGALRATLTAAVLLASPHIMLYLFVARGYLLGTLLSLAAAMALKNRQPLRAGLLGGMAGATVPTFGFLIPGMLVAHLAYAPLRAGLREAARFAAPAALIMGATWLPHRAAMAAHGKRWGLAWRAFVSGVMETIGNGQLLSFALGCCVVSLCALMLWRRTKLPHLTALLWASAASFVFIAVLTSIAGGSHAPYVRGATPLAPFIALGFVLSLDALGRHARRAGLALVIVNAMVGGWTWVRTFGPGGDLQHYPGLAELNPTSAERLVSLHRDQTFESVDSAWGAAPVAQLYANALGVPFQQVAVDAGTSDCSVGQTPPVSAIARVWIVSQNQRLLVCR